MTSTSLSQTTSRSGDPSLSNSKIQRQPRNFAPPANQATYMDVLKFEQRLIQNAERLDKQRRNYQTFLLALILTIMYLLYRVFLSPSIYIVVRYTDMGLLLIAITSLVLFFVSGIYSEKISRAYKFVPQANRSLRPLNIYLNTKPPSSFPLYLSIPTLFTRRKENAFSSGLISTPASPTTKTKKVSTSQKPSTSPRQPISQIPPPTNPKGELIFSNRVDPNFREGYARFRSEWQKRRAAAHVQPSRGWFGRRGQPDTTPDSEHPTHTLHNAESGRGRETGKASIPSSSRRPSPSPSRRSISSTPPRSSKSPSPTLHRSPSSSPRSRSTSMTSEEGDMATSGLKLDVSGLQSP